MRHSGQADRSAVAELVLPHMMLTRRLKIALVALNVCAHMTGHSTVECVSVHSLMCFVISVCLRPCLTRNSNAGVCQSAGECGE